MSSLQEQAVQMLGQLPDEDVQLVIGLLRRLIPQPQSNPTPIDAEIQKKLDAVARLAQYGSEIHGHLPEDWDLEREIAEAIDEKYCRTN